MPSASIPSFLSRETRTSAAGKAGEESSQACAYGAGSTAHSADKMTATLEACFSQERLLVTGPQLDPRADVAHPASGQVTGEFPCSRCTFFEVQHAGQRIGERLAEARWQRDSKWAGVAFWKPPDEHVGAALRLSALCNPLTVAAVVKTGFRRYPFDNPEGSAFEGTSDA